MRLLFIYFFCLVGLSPLQCDSWGPGYTKNKLPSRSFLGRNKKLFAVGLGGAVGLAAAAGLYSYLRKNQENKANQDQQKPGSSSGIDLGQAGGQQRLGQSSLEQKSPRDEGIERGKENIAKNALDKLGLGLSPEAYKKELQAAQDIYDEAYRNDKSSNEDDRHWTARNKLSDYILEKIANIKLNDQQISLGGNQSQKSSERIPTQTGSNISSGGQKLKRSSSFDSQVGLELKKALFNLEQLGEIDGASRDFLTVLNPSYKYYENSAEILKTDFELYLRKVLRNSGLQVNLDQNVVDAIRDMEGPLLYDERINDNDPKVIAEAFLDYASKAIEFLEKQFPGKAEQMKSYRDILEKARRQLQDAYPVQQSSNQGIYIPEKYQVHENLKASGRLQTKQPSRSRSNSSEQVTPGGESGIFPNQYNLDQFVGTSQVGSSENQQQISFELKNLETALQGLLKQFVSDPVWASVRQAVVNYIVAKAGEDNEKIAATFGRVKNWKSNFVALAKAHGSLEKEISLPENLKWVNVKGSKKTGYKLIDSVIAYIVGVVEKMGAGQGVLTDLKNIQNSFNVQQMMEIADKEKREKEEQKQIEEPSQEQITMPPAEFRAKVDGENIITDLRSFLNDDRQEFPEPNTKASLARFIIEYLKSFAAYINDNRIKDADTLTDIEQAFEGLSARLRFKPLTWNKQSKDKKEFLLNVLDYLFAMVHQLNYDYSSEAGEAHTRLLNALWNYAREKLGEALVSSDLKDEETFKIK